MTTPTDRARAPRPGDPDSLQTGPDSLYPSLPPAADDDDDRVEDVAPPRPRWMARLAARDETALRELGGEL